MQYLKCARCGKLLEVCDVVGPIDEQALAELCRELELRNAQTFGWFPGDDTEDDY